MRLDRRPIVLCPPSVAVIRRQRGGEYRPPPPSRRASHRGCRNCPQRGTWNDATTQRPNTCCVLRPCVWRWHRTNTEHVDIGVSRGLCDFWDAAVCMPLRYSSHHHPSALGWQSNMSGWKGSACEFVGLVNTASTERVGGRKTERSMAPFR